MDRFRIERDPQCRRDGRRSLVVAATAASFPSLLLLPPPFSPGRNIIKASTNTHTGGWNDLIHRDFLPKRNNKKKHKKKEKENDDDLIPSGMYGPIYHIP
jgi:hypothetical protein